MEAFSHVLVCLKHFKPSLNLQMKMQALGMPHKGLCDPVADLALALLLLNVHPSNTNLLLFLTH